MSNAKPMGDEQRAANYRTQRGQRPGHLHVPLTPRQWRRIVHKQRAGQYGYGYPGTKGRPTPRRSAARAAMLERRRG